MYPSRIQDKLKKVISARRSPHRGLRRFSFFPFKSPLNPCVQLRRGKTPSTVQNTPFAVLCYGLCGADRRIQQGLTGHSIHAVTRCTRAGSGLRLLYNTFNGGKIRRLRGIPAGRTEFTYSARGAEQRLGIPCHRGRRVCSTPPTL